MARYIHKHTCRIWSEVQVYLDPGAEILAVGAQYDPSWLDDVVVFWTIRDDGVLPGPPRTFRVVGTGSQLPEGAVYRGTAQVKEEVWHLVEIGALS